MLSVIVLAKNQTDQLKTCLESVKWADEIIVVTDDSPPETIAVARPFTEHIVNHPLRTFAGQRNFGMSQAHGDWVLYVDPDERVLVPLCEEIILAISQNPEHVAYAIPRRNFFLGKEMQVVGGWPDYVIRLLKKDAFETWTGDLHEQPTFRGTLGHCTNPFIHLTHTDITSMTEKTLRWSHLEAELRLRANHPPMRSWRFFRILATSFFEWYVKKGGYKSGTEGTIEAIFQTFSVFFSYVRLWEMQRKPSLPESYTKIDESLRASDFTAL